MLAIQNQISVLSKILATKIQHQQIIDHQQAVSASLKKMSTPTPSRSRKTSTNQETSSQSGSGKEKAGNISNVHASNERLQEVSNVNEIVNEVIANDSSIPESTGCTIS